METKKFNLNVVASVVTGRLLTKPKSSNDNGIGDLYEILEWMTGDAPYTHQLGRFMDECKPYLLEWFPSLSNCISQLHVLDNLMPAAERGGGTTVAVEHYINWLRGEMELLPFYDIPKIPKDDHTVKDPIAESQEMFGAGKIITLNVSEDEI